MMILKTKKHFVSLVSLLLAFLFLCASPLLSLYANAVSQGEIDTLQEERDKLKEEEEAQQAKIDELEDTRALFVDRKLALDEKIELNQREIQLISSQIEIYDQMIAEKEAELEEAMEAEKQQSQLLRSRMRAMEEHGTYSYIAFIFQAKSITDFLSRLSDVDDIMHYDQELQQLYMASREKVEKIKANYEETRAEQEELKKELDTKQAQLDAQIEAAYTMIANIEELSENAQAEYDAIAASRKEAEDKIDQLLAELAAQKAAAAAAAAAASGGGTSGSGSSGGGGYTPTSVVSLSNFMWPVPSCTLITSRFGYRVSPTAGASSYHGGLDIGAQQGASIVASEAGQIIYAGANGGYGNCVMIDHGEGIVTLYGHMSSIGVSYGQIVSKGDYIGAVGSTGVSTGPHCHFEIRINGGQTDPAPYFGGLSYWNC